MIHICEHFEQLNNLIEPLSDDYVDQIAIHVCKIEHRDIICCECAEIMHNGSNPCVTIIYIPSELETGTRIIINQLQAHFPNQRANNPNNEFIFSCPGCGNPFSQQ